MSAEQEALNQIALGLDAQRFLESALGRHLNERSIEVVENAMLALKEVDPSDVKTITALQFEIRVAEAGYKWLQEAVATGNVAEAVLINQQG